MLNKGGNRCGPVKSALLMTVFLLSTGCSSDPTDYVECKVNGVVQHMYTDSFNTLITDRYFITGYMSKSVPPDLSKNTLTLVLPRDVKTGSAYTQASAGARLEYLDGAGVIYYGSKSAATFSINVTKWLGPGSYGEGTFSGTLYTDDGKSSVTITDGSFLGWIYN